MLLYYLLAGFLGYFIGRLGHIYGGDINFFHHWVYGLLIFFIGIFLIYYNRKRKLKWLFLLGWILIYFSVSFIISDLKDFIDFKIYGIDDVKILKFWGID